MLEAHYGFEKMTGMLLANNRLRGIAAVHSHQVHLAVLTTFMQEGGGGGGQLLALHFLPAGFMQYRPDYMCPVEHSFVGLTRLCN